MLRKHVIAKVAILAGFSLAHSPVSFAGWSGQMNGYGYGRALANVTSSVGTGASASITTTGPTADIEQIPLTPGGAIASANLPRGANSTSKALAQGFSGLWTASTFASGGDRADNAAIESLALPITPQTDALLDLFTHVTDNNDGTSTFNFSGFASGGTALLVRGFQWAPGADGQGPTTDDLQKYADGLPVANIPNHGVGHFLSSPDPLVGSGPVPDGEPPNQNLLSITLPNTDPLNTFLFIDGLAESTSAVPDSGAFLGAFSLTICGMLMARRLIGQTRAA